MAECNNKALNIRVSPALLADSRVKHKNSNISVDGRQVLLTVIYQRFKDLAISPEDRAVFLKRIDAYHKFDHLAEYPIGILLEDYSSKLKSDVRYGGIWDKVKGRNPDDSALKYVHDNYSQTISEMFLQYRLNMFVDDRIMMSFLMATELISEAVLGSHCSRAVIIFKSVITLLCLSDANRTSFSATPQLVNSWPMRYEELIDPARRCDILVYYTCQPEPEVVIMPPIAKIFASHKPDEPDVIAAFCPQLNSTADSNPAHAEAIASPKPKIPWYNIDARVRLPESRVTATTGTVLHSYIYNRFVERNFSVGLIERFLKRRKVRVNYKNRALGVAISDYGEAISSTEEYSKIKEQMTFRLSKTLNPVQEFVSLVSKYILNLHSDAFLFDRIMTVIHLTSDNSNDFMRRGDSEGAYALFSSTTNKLNRDARYLPSYRSNIWKQIVELKEELVNRTEFDLLSDRSFIYPERKYPPLSEKTENIARRQLNPLIVHPDPLRFFSVIPTSQQHEFTKGAEIDEGDKIASSHKVQRADDSGNNSLAKNVGDCKYLLTSTTSEANGIDKFDLQEMLPVSQNTIMAESCADTFLDMSQSRKRSQVQQGKFISRGPEPKKQKLNTDLKSKISSEHKEQQFESSIISADAFSVTEPAFIPAEDEGEQLSFEAKTRYCDEDIAELEPTCASNPTTDVAQNTGNNQVCRNLAYQISTGLDREGTDEITTYEVNPGEYYVNIDHGGVHETFSARVTLNGLSAIRKLEFLSPGEEEGLRSFMEAKKYDSNSNIDVQQNTDIETTQTIDGHRIGIESKNENINERVNNKPVCEDQAENSIANINCREYFVMVDSEGNIGPLQYEHSVETLNAGFDNKKDGDTAQTMDSDDEPDEQGWYTSGSSKFRVT